MLLLCSIYAAITELSPEINFGKTMWVADSQCMPNRKPVGYLLLCAGVNIKQIFFGFDLLYNFVHLSVVENLSLLKLGAFLVYAAFVGFRSE
jgi:hypothetical protein